MDLSQLQFGKPAAERDLDGLRDYFIESATFDRIMSGEKRFVLGNRGAGKSAIFKTVAQREKVAGSVVLELAPEDYSYQMLTEVLARHAEVPRLVRDNLLGPRATTSVAAASHSTLRA